MSEQHAAVAAPEVEPRVVVLDGHRHSMKHYVYLQFKDKDSFAAFRMRSGQSRTRLFELS